MTGWLRSPRFFMWLLSAGGLFRVGQVHCQKSHRGQEGAKLIDGLNADPVGQSPDQRRTKAAEAKEKPEENTGNHPDAMGHQRLGKDPSRPSAPA